MTILRSILERGYFPKELPPAFFTEAFAAYAFTKNGRAALNGYNPSEGFTECVGFDLALPGVARRNLQFPHPAHFLKLAGLTSKNFKRLLAKAASPFSKSRPIYSMGQFRAINPNVRPSNLARERAASRAGASHLVRLDVSHFYPSLYTHAVGWALDPRLRSKKHWKNFKLLGKQLDQLLMDMQHKISQGIPIGSDVSFLLGEVVLAQVDRYVKVPRERCYRWFDDYEIACNSRQEAESVLATLLSALRSFNLRPNTRKTQIVDLPHAAREEWQHAVTEQLPKRIITPNDMVTFFDSAFRIRDQFRESPVLMYALGSLFRIADPGPEIGRVALSGISQALLAEPGAAQKGLALLTYWALNGFALDRPLLTSTINRMIYRHAALGVSSDVAWALAFAIEQRIKLNAKAAKVLAGCEDDCALILGLDAYSRGLMPKGFSLKRVDTCLASATLDGEHWLVAYESVRHGFRPVCKKMVGDNPLFADMLTRKITFYRRKLPPYASVIHQGGAPEWLVARWLNVASGRVQPSNEEAKAQENNAVVNMLRDGVGAAVEPSETAQEAVATLLDAAQQTRSEVKLRLSDYEPYAS